MNFKKRLSLVCIILIILIFIIFFFIYFKPFSKPFPCDINCSLGKLENTLKLTCNSTHGVAYMPSYFYFHKENNVFIGNSYYYGSVNYWASSHFYVNLDKKEIELIENSELEELYNNLDYWDYNFECTANNCYTSPVNLGYHPNLSIDCSSKEFNYEKVEFLEIDEYGLINFTLLKDFFIPINITKSLDGIYYTQNFYTNKEKKFYKFDYEGHPIYIGEDIIFYKKPYRISQGFSSVLNTIIIEGEHDFDINNFDEYTCIKIISNFTIIQRDSFYKNDESWCKNIELPKYIKFFNYLFK